MNSNSGCVYKAPPPSDPSNLTQVIHDILDADACAIEAYSKLSEEYRITDIVTHEIFDNNFIFSFVFVLMYKRRIYKLI